jgi:hypothetical protein
VGSATPFDHTPIRDEVSIQMVGDTKMSADYVELFQNKLETYGNLIKFKFFAADGDRNGRLWFIFENSEDNERFFSDLETSSSLNPAEGEEPKVLENGKAVEGTLKFDDSELYYRRQLFQSKERVEVTEETSKTVYIGNLNFRTEEW